MLIRALLAFFVLPGVAALLLPPLLVTLDPWRAGLIWQGGSVLMVAGLALLLWCVRDFYVQGKGTLAPWDPPKHLVIVGLYRFVRNPMYVGVLTLVAGWAVLFASPLLAMYTVALAIGFHLRVIVNEEPWLHLQFGEEWELYRANVGRWMPRRMPWSKG